MSAAVTPAKASRVAPTDLVLDENVRRTVRLDSAFKKSIATRGVRIPIMVRYDPLGQLLVVEGQRRTLAAIEAGLTDVPVVLVDDIADDAARIVEQLGANHHRAPVEHADDAAAIQKLALFGWSPTKITKELSRTKDDVNAALALADAPEQTRAVVAAAGIDLVTAAKIADVAGGRADVAEKLTRSALEEPSQIEHRLEQQRREVEVLDAIDAKKAELVADGVRILDERPENGPEVYLLSSLSDTAATNGDAPAIDETAHRDTCPGHAVCVVRPSWWERDEGKLVSVNAFCVGWQAQGHFVRYARSSSGTTSGPKSEEATAERRRVIANNKASDAAQVVRRRFVTELLQRTQLPADAIEYAATMIARFPMFVNDYAGREILKEIYPTAARQVEKVQQPGKVEATRALLAIGLQIGEHGLPRDFWRTATKEYGGQKARGVRHLEQLRQWGYTLADVETEWLKGKGAKK